MLLPKRLLRGAFPGVIIALAGLAGILAYARLRTPTPEVPAPKDLAKLEPQLRDYVTANLQWVREAPRRADRHARLGLIYAVNGLWFEARQAFQNAALLDGNEPLAQMYIGVASQETGDFNAAAKTFREVTTRFPKFAPGFYRLGYVELRTGNLDDAEKAFQRLTILSPQEWRGHAGLGEIMIRKGRFSDAVPWLEKALQLEPAAKIAHHLLGQAYRGLGRVEAAEWEQQLGKNAEASPMPDAWSAAAIQHIRVLQDQVQLANECFETGEPGKAVEILERAFAYHPDNFSLMNQLAIALNRANQPQKARALLRQALDKNDRYVPALITLSLCLQMLNENEAALATAERAMTLAPDVPQSHIAKANALLALERDSDALGALQFARRLDPKNAEIPMQMGDILWRNLNRVIEAKERYEEARNLDPVLVPILVRLGDLYLHLGDLDQARACLARLRRLSPALPELRVLEERLGNRNNR